MTKGMVPILAWAAIMLMEAIGCKGETGPVGPSGILSGDLYGRMYLFDEDSARITDRSGVTVSVAGTNKSGQSDRNGWWRINGLSTGTYTLVFSKPGYGTYKQFGFQFTGGDSLYSGFWALGNTARYYVTSFSFSIGTDSVVHLTGTVSSSGPPNNSRFVLVFLDTISAVSSTRYMATLDTYISTSTSFGLNFQSSEFAGYYGITRGSHLYCVAFGMDGTFGNAYFDPTLRVAVYPTLSPQSSNVLDIPLP